MFYDSKEQMNKHDELHENQECYTNAEYTSSEENAGAAPSVTFIDRFKRRPIENEDAEATKKHLILTRYHDSFREKIKTKGEGSGIVKGMANYAEVHIRFEPQIEKNDLVFIDALPEHRLPPVYIAAVEREIREASKKGVIAGFPMVGLKATLFDASYHPVASSESAFEEAARLAYKDGVPKTYPTILEPLGILKTKVPVGCNLEEIMHEISSKRRGTILEMDMDIQNETTVILACVPFIEMDSYEEVLRKSTDGRGSFELVFDCYEEAPGSIQELIKKHSRNTEANLK